LPCPPECPGAFVAVDRSVTGRNASQFMIKLTVFLPYAIILTLYMTV
jgi:hypothetical protein